MKSFFPNILLKPHKCILLDNIVLHNIGKINVICGKNNSGKTSVLESILNLKSQYLHNIYFQLNNDLIVELLDVSYGKEISNTAKNCAMALEEILHKHKDFLFSAKDINSLVSLVKNDYDQRQDISPKIRFRSFQGYFIGRLNEYIKDFLFEPVLVNAHRNLQDKPEIKDDIPVESNGENLTNKLFHIFNSDKKEIYNKINAAFYEITNYHFKIDLSNKRNLSLKFSTDFKTWTEYKNCGMGLIDVLIILWFALGIEDSPVLIEEPESHIHPEMQRKLLAYIKNNTDKQFFFTTHSNIFLDPTYADKIFYTEIKDGAVQISEVTSRAETLQNLGYSISDNICADLILFVEGPTDRMNYEVLLKKFGLYEKYTISIFYLGGDFMKHFNPEDYIQSIPYDRVYAIVDKDPNSDKYREDFKLKCNESGINLTTLKRYSIENYLTVDSLKQYYGNKKPELEGVECIDPDKPIKDSIGFSPDKNLTYKFLENMTKSDIEDTDLYDFLQKIKEKLEG